ncbi:MAG TPA: tetratricopeptide repeat protein [Myxococcota bacterium]|nr:tetratricopeptide repeat protein [Myxococcota bacterium]
MRDWLRWGRPSKPAPERTATAQLRSALHLVLAGDLPAAEAQLAEAARLDSSSSDVYLALANLYRLRGDIGRAIQVHQNLLLRPDISDELRREALLGLALDFRAGGFLKRAGASFEDLLRLEPGNLQALRALERIKIDSGDWEGAVQIRNQIGSRDPATPKVLAHLWTGHGRGRAARGIEAEARRAFKRAVAQDPDCAEAYVALGDQRFREGSTKKAIGLFRRALGLHPAIGRLLYPRLYESYEKLGDMAGLERLLRERMDVEPEDADAALWLARAIAAQSRADEALAHLQRLLDRAPAQLALHAEIGRVLLRENRELEARKAFEELLERLPTEPRALACRSCGAQDLVLHFRCPQCGEWDSFS